MAKIGPILLAENILIEIVLRVHVMVRRISSNISGFTGPIVATFHHMKALYVPMIDLDLFSNISRDVAMATNFVPKMANSTFVILAFRNGLG